MHIFRVIHNLNVLAALKKPDVFYGQSLRTCKRCKYFWSHLHQRHLSLIRIELFEEVVATNCKIRFTFSTVIYSRRVLQKIIDISSK